MMMGIILIIFAFIAVATVCALIYGGYYLYRTSTYRYHKRCRDPWDLSDGRNNYGKKYDVYQPQLTETQKCFCEMGLSGEKLEIASKDGLWLRGRFIKNDSPNVRGVFLMFHGYRSSPVYDFGASAESIYNLGFHLCAVSQRAHGESDGDHFTYGVRESEDVLCWCNHLREKLGEIPIILMGVSMGASTVMMASDLPLPKNVRGIIADCGFTSPKEICRKVMKKDMHLPCFPLYNIAEIIVRHRAKFRFNEKSCVGAVANTKLPLMLIHGMADDFVPYSMALEIKESCNGKCFFVSAEKAGHGESFLTDRELYMSTLRDFLQYIGL